MLQILSSQFFYRDLFSYPISCEEIVGARKKKDDGGNSRTDLLPGDDCDSIRSRLGLMIQLETIHKNQNLYQKYLFYC